jgi:Tfp pilus assembly protein PilN
MKRAKDYINLLPRKEKAPYPVMATIVFLFVLSWIAVFGLQLKRAWDLRDELGPLAAQNQMLQQELALMKKELGPASAFGVTQEKGALIRDLLTQRVLWSDVFKQFSVIVPPGVWFDSLEGNSTGRTEIKIRGGAVNYLTLGQFMTVLEKSGYFRAPQLRYAQKAVVKGREIVNYEITCEIKRESVN